MASKCCAWKTVAFLLSIGKHFYPFSTHSGFKMICMHISVFRDSSPKNENSVINYSPSYASKPVRPSFIYATQIKILLMKSESFLTLHRQSRILLEHKKKRLYSTISSLPCQSSTRVHENTTAMFSLRTKSILVASQNYCWNTDVTWTILTMSLLPFWALNVSMKGQKVLRFYQKYLNLCSEDERKSYGFITTWGRVINDRIFIFWLTIPLTYCLIEKKVPISESKTKQVATSSTLSFFNQEGWKIFLRQSYRCENRPKR